MRTSIFRASLWLAVAAAGLQGLAADKDAPDNVEAQLARASRPWTQPVLRLTLEQYTETLHYWAEKHPRWMTMETRGRSKEGLPIFLVKITDSSVSDAQKQIVLVTAMHSGSERTGATSVLHFLEWLLGDSPVAATVRQRQIVLLMPIVNPWGFFTTSSNNNSQGVDPYSAQRGKEWDIEKLVLKHPERAPEIVAVQSVVDDFKPDVQRSYGWTPPKEVLDRLVKPSSK